MKQEIIKHTPNVELHLHKAIKLFGITKNMNEAGFLLVNGKFLNLSNYGIRGDHNDIAEIFEDERKYENDSTDSILLQFEREGNIRLKPEAPGFEVLRAPNRSQKEPLYSFIQYFLNREGKIYIDIIDNDGNIISSKTYLLGDDIEKILKSIENGCIL